MMSKILGARQKTIMDRDISIKKEENIYSKEWDKPINVAFVLKSGMDLESSRKFFIYKLLKEGHTVHIFFFKGWPEKSLKDHINIKYHRIPRCFFRYHVLLNILNRKKRKKIDLIVAHGKSAKFFKQKSHIHETKTVDYTEEKAIKSIFKNRVGSEHGKK